MADSARRAGSAKGTLYNHFRTKEAVYAAAVDAGIRSLAEECATVAREDLAEALAIAADRVGSHPALRRIAGDEPLVLAQLVQLPEGGLADVARVAVREVLAAAGCDDDQPSVELVLRWLVSFVATSGAGIEAQAARLAAALRPLPQGT
jgi:AcrR family transcriptional regulator